jgi:hypothetical protein
LLGFASEISHFFTPLGWIQIQVKPQRPRLRQNAAAPPPPNALGIPNLPNDALQHDGGKGRWNGSADTETAVLAARGPGTGKRKIAKQMGIDVSTVSRILTEAA